MSRWFRVSVQLAVVLPGRDREVWDLGVSTATQLFPVRLLRRLKLLAMTGRERPHRSAVWIKRTDSETRLCPLWARAGTAYGVSLSKNAMMPWIMVRHDNERIPCRGNPCGCPGIAWQIVGSVPAPWDRVRIPSGRAPTRGAPTGEMLAGDA